MMAHKVKAEGPGLDYGVEIGKPTYFTIAVNAPAASTAKLDVQFTGPGKGDAIRDFEMIHHYDNTYTVKYTPLQQGTVRVSVMYGGDHIARSPFLVTVSPNLDLGKIKVFGLHDRVEVGKEQEFSIQSTGTGGQGRVAARITGPGKPVSCKVEPGPISDNSMVKFILLEEGQYEVHVTYDGAPVPGSPFHVDAMPATFPAKVNAYGAGLRSGIAGCPASFAIDARGSENGDLCLTVVGPGAAKFECRRKCDSTWSVNYLPMKHGEYIISILLSDTHVPGSPFKAQIVHPFDNLK